MKKKSFAIKKTNFNNKKSDFLWAGKTKSKT